MAAAGPPRSARLPDSWFAGHGVGEAADDDEKRLDKPGAVQTTLHENKKTISKQRKRTH
jgi:hypothetical protein